MSLNLTVEDLRLLNQAQRTLLSPMAMENPQRWTDEVASSVTRLVGADSGAFQVAPPEGPPLTSMVNLEPCTIQQYVDHYAARELLPPSTEPAVHYLPERVTRERLERSEIYNDFWKPTRQFDNLAAVAPTEDGWQAGMFLHHADEGGPRFGDRGKALLNLLLPVMVSGARTYRQWLDGQRKFLRFLDRVEDGLLLCGVDGGVRHANPGFGRMMRRDPESERIRSEAEAMARHLARLLNGRGDEEAHPGGAAPRRLTTRAGTYRVQGSFLDEAALGGPGILITIQRAGGALPDVATLRSRFDLTKRQAEVALLLAQRKTNEEVAERLFISPHTARRHTENVFLKLGVTSRLDIREAITA